MADDRSRINAMLPEYLVERELGRGAMGVVYLGRHKRLDRTVAIKQVPPQFATDEKVRARFRTEARVMASLDHPHVVPVYDFVERDGLMVLVMEELPGGTVWEHFTQTGFTAPQAVAVVMATCSGLHHADERQVLHRDIKPDNLMFDRAGVLKVTDFGIAKVIGGGQTLATVDGGVLGTPAYMAPEQALALEVSPAADVYASGSMLYELLSGQLPFTGAESPMAMLFQRVNDNPTPLSDVAPHVPTLIAESVMKAIARDPADRYPTPEAFGIALGEAAATSWGVDWLNASGYTIQGSERLAAAARTTIDAERYQQLAAEQAPGGGTITDAAIINEILQPAPPSPASVHPESPVRVEGGLDLNRVDREDLVVASEMLKPPGFPFASLVLGLAALAVMVALAFSGLGDPSRDVDDGLAAELSVNGQSLLAEGPVVLDLSEDVSVGVTTPGAQSAELEFSALGIPLGSVDGDVTGSVAVLEPGALQYLAGGAATGTITISDAAGDEISSTEFATEIDKGWLTAVAAVTVLLILGVFAYAEANMRPLRKGRRKIGRLIGLALTGAVLGLTIVLVADLVSKVEPTLVTIIVAAILGAVGLALLGWSLIAVGRRRRMRRAGR